jgi:hypothetical protein
LQLLDAARHLKPDAFCKGYDISKLSLAWDNDMGMAIAVAQGGAALHSRSMRRLRMASFPYPACWPGVRQIFE